jgi:hypothetical protein
MPMKADISCSCVYSNITKFVDVSTYNWVIFNTYVGNDQSLT